MTSPRSVRPARGRPRRPRRSAPLLSQVDERRNPRTKATVNQLLDRYLDVVDLEESTRKAYVGYLERNVRAVLGSLPLSKLDGEVLDAFYAELRCCRIRCDKQRRRELDHRTKAQHECDDRCKPHVCRPLAPSAMLLAPAVGARRPALGCRSRARASSHRICMERSSSTGFEPAALARQYDAAKRIVSVPTASSPQAPTAGPTAASSR
jgi:hypothetical protein